MSAWTYDERAHRYRHGETGRFLSPASERALASDFLERRGQAVADLAARVSDGRSSVQAWEKQMAAHVKQVHGVLYAAGRGGMAQVSEAEWSDLATVVRAQQRDYLRPFAEQLAAGQLTAAQIANRAGLYVDAANASYWQGKAATYEGLRLPGQPGIGTGCGPRCRCSWEVEESDAEWLATWVAADDEGTCETCSTRAAEWAPYVQPT